MENGVGSNLQSPGRAVRNSSGIFYVLKDLSSYTLSMVKAASGIFFFAILDQNFVTFGDFLYLC